MKAYFDTSVANVFLFGEEREKERYRSVIKVFDALNEGKMEGLISMYTLQEIHAFCQQNFPEEDANRVARLAFLRLLENALDVCPLLTRLEKTLNQRRFPISDRSDLPHVIVADLQGCDAILTYDSHVDEVEDWIRIYSPESFLREMFQELD